MLGLTGFLGLARIPLCFWAHTDLTDPTVSLCGWEISQMFCVWAGSHGFHFAFGLTRISQIPRYSLWVGNLTDASVGGLCSRIPLTSLGSHGSHSTVFFVGGKSHRWLCGCGLVCGSEGAHCSRSHGFIFRTYRTNQTYRTYLLSDGLGIFKKIIREICGICVRPR